MLIKVVRNSGRSIPSSSIIFRCLSSVENQGGKMSSFEQQAKADGDNLMRFYMAVKKVSKYVKFTIIYSSIYLFFYYLFP